MPGLSELLSSGGPIVAVLLVVSIISIAVIVAKLVQLRGVLSGERQRAAAFEHWANGDRAAATEALAATASPADRILRRAMDGLTRGLRRPALEADLEWRGNAEITSLSRYIRLLELIAMVSPLLGLLGTVLGMIQAFQELSLAEGAANASLLAAGIWQALLTTAVGLIVAIPAAVAATLLSARVERAGHMIEIAVGQLFALEDERR
jgi:biopolymer transport protein ExbB